ncbi:MAG TPA: hypothetical protein EYH08_00555 [Pyrodictium sp.]|nr:hypothetical protein [Pyrodictium sp.]
MIRFRMGVVRLEELVVGLEKRVSSIAFVSSCAIPHTPNTSFKKLYSPFSVLDQRWTKIDTWHLLGLPSYSQAV